MICTQAHLITALSEIANTYQGAYYPRWAAWWNANRTFTRQKWIFDGFAAGGLHPADPVDERFGLELIEALNSERIYFRPNAERILRSTPAEIRRKWLDIAAVSSQRLRRLGVVTDLTFIDQSGDEDLLRTLARDSDLDIRRKALAALDQRFVNSPGAKASGEGCFCRVRDGVQAVSFAGNLLIVLYGDRVDAFDPQTRHLSWSRRTARWWGDFILAEEQQVILASRSGALLALDLRGRIRWSRAADNQNWTDDNSNEVEHLLRYADQLVVVRRHTLERLRLATGAPVATYRAVDYISGADAGAAVMCLVDGSGLHCLPGGDREFPHGRGVSVSRDSVCFARGEAKDEHVTCLSAAGLSERWNQPFYVFGSLPLLDGSRLFVDSSSGLTALKSADGSIMWATEEPGSSGRILPTEFGLLTAGAAAFPSLRDSETGEIRRVWPQVTWISGAAVHGKWAAFADTDVVWLLDLSGRRN